MAGLRRATPASREEREAGMLHAAGEVFAERGFHAASMDEIADRVGVSKPVVYSHFGSKEALYFAYIEAAGTELTDAMVAAEGATRDGAPDERLHAGARAFFRFVDDHRDGFVVLYAELGARGAPFRREVIEIRRRIAGLIQVLLGEALADAGVDELEVGGLEPLAAAIVGAGESLANWWLEHPSENVDALAARLMNVTWVGLDHLGTGRATSWPTVE